MLITCVSVCIANAANIDYVELAAEVRFAPFEQMSCTNISIIDNNIVGEEGVKIFTVELFSNNSKVAVVGSGESAQVSIIENDGMPYGPPNIVYCIYPGIQKDLPSTL